MIVESPVKVSVERVGRWSFTVNAPPGITFVFFGRAQGAGASLKHGSVWSGKIPSGSGILVYEGNQLIAVVDTKGRVL